MHEVVLGFMPSCLFNADILSSKLAQALSGQMQALKPFLFCWR